jgi:LysM repeat protein
VVYKVSPDGAAAALYNAAEDSITSLAVDASGNVYAGTGSGKGNIYKIAASGSAKPVYDKAPRALSMAMDSANNLYTVSDDQVVMIAPDETVTSIDTKRAGAQFVAVAVDKGGTVFAGTANSGAVYRASGASHGDYESPVHDAGMPSRWGTMSFIANTPQGASVTVETRTGNVGEPDSSWSPWTSVRSGQQVTSPAARYIQYRAALSGAGSATPELKQVTVAYMTENRPPKVTVSDPQPGSVLARTAAVKWMGVDPDKDALSYELFYSADSGKTWQPLGTAITQPKNGAQAEPAKEPAAKEEPKPETPKKEEPAASVPDAGEIMAQLKTELDQHPEIPQDVREKMMDEAPAAVDKAVSAASKPDAEPSADDSQPDASQGSSTKQTSFNWDTTKVPDGSYLIKVVASDRISNAAGFLTDQKVTGPVTVANKPPKIMAFKKDLKVNPDKTVSVDGYAFDDGVAIAGVQYKVDSGDWMSAAAKDGMFDSTSESFEVSTQTLGKGKHTIEVKAIDAAGNAASDKVAVSIP